MFWKKYTFWMEFEARLEALALHHEITARERLVSVAWLKGGSIMCKPSMSLIMPTDLLLFTGLHMFSEPTSLSHWFHECSNMQQLRRSAIHLKGSTYSSSCFKTALIMKNCGNFDCTIVVWAIGCYLYVLHVFEIALVHLAQQAPAATEQNNFQFTLG